MYFGGTGEQANLFQGNNGTGTHGGPYYLIWIYIYCIRQNYLLYYTLLFGLKLQTIKLMLPTHQNKVHFRVIVILQPLLTNDYRSFLEAYLQYLHNKT